MTREEAFVYAIAKKAELEVEIHRSRSEYGDWAMYSRELYFIAACISALKGPTREQVEKMRGEWEWFDEEVRAPFEYQEREWGWRCSKCGVVLPDDFDNPYYTPPMRFCENCGAPMTDEAVDMTMKKLEEMQND